MYSSVAPEPFNISIEEQSVTEIPPKKIYLPLASNSKSKAELIYHCTVEGCTSHFFTHVGLRKHVESVHEESAFVCNICQKRFRYQSTLKDHMNLHSELKSYLCDICSKYFSTKQNLENHGRVHSGVTPYTCQLCQM